ncbi:MAG TPA: hypothetical protein VGQ09_09540, partial [Chitinophagaceae bacterium]|nr:hypothetical protein [Chitinophagaceae bacterium]
MKGFITSFAMSVNQASGSLFGKSGKAHLVSRISLNIFFLFCFLGVTQLLVGQVTSRSGRPIVNAAPHGGSCDGLFTITTNKTYNAITNQTTFTWTVTKTGAKNALSHWEFPLTVCPENDGNVIQKFLSSIVSAQASDDCINYHNTVTSYGKDPSEKCLTGDLFKFDEEMGNVTTKCYRLIVTGNWSIIPAIASVKFGNQCCTITLNNPGCLEEICIPPACNISTTPDNVCPGSTNTYNATPSGLDSYSWSITGNGTIVGSTTGQSVQVLAGTCGTFTLTLITRQNGCENTCSQIIHVTDNTPPTINTGANVTIECTATPSFTAPTASDACNGATVSIVGADVTGGIACARTVTRTWRAVDACGNTSVTRSQTITIVDTQAPTIGSAGANATIECTATPSFTAPTASDACNGATVSVVGADVTGGTACARTVTRTWRATDACGNQSATRSQTITIIDTQAPTIGNAGANATIECTASPSFTAPTASDACSGATVNTVGADVTGGTACARTVTRTWRAVDACGNTSATRSQTITIVDTQAPTIGSAGANATIECTATPSFTAPTASDACNGATVSIVGADVTGGTACARTVTRTWRAVDACGNTSITRSQTITIVDSQAPTIGSAGANATIECTASPSFTAPTASDACNGATVNIVGADVTGGTACARTVTRTWNAVDACGNTSATRSQTITIVDTQAPTIGSAGANATIECTATPSF